MTNANEPTDVGPAAGGHLPAGDADRDHVVTLLTAAHAEGRLTADERDTRISAARSAQTFDDLVPLTRDLVSPTGPAARPLIRYDEANASEVADQIVAVFAGASRKRTWRVRRNTSILTIFGGAELDLSQATFEAHEVTFNVFCLFGGVEITIPAGMDVDNQVMALFGGSDVRKIAPPDATSPKLVIRGFVGFGGVDVRNPKLGKNRH